MLKLSTWRYHPEAKAPTLQGGVDFRNEKYVGIVYCTWQCQSPTRHLSTPPYRMVHEMYVRTVDSHGLWCQSQCSHLAQMPCQPGGVWGFTLWMKSNLCATDPFAQGVAFTFIVTDVVEKRSRRESAPLTPPEQVEKGVGKFLGWCQLFDSFFHFKIIFSPFIFRICLGKRKK